MGWGWGTQILQVSVFKKIRCKASLNLFLGKLLKSDFFKKFYNYLKVWIGCSKKKSKISVHDVTVGLRVSFFAAAHLCSSARIRTGCNKTDENDLYFTSLDIN